MSCHLLLNLLHELANMILCEALPSIISFLPTNLLHELANMILCEALPSIISFLPTNVINLVINDNEFEILFIT